MPNREPLYPHTSKRKETLFPHEPKGQQSQSLKHFWVEKNLPYDTWAIVEAWPGGTVRSPFETKEKAVKQEEEITEGIWKIKQVPSPQEKFPKQYEALKKLYPYEFIEYHDDGDLTIQLLVPPKDKRWPVPFRELVKGDVIVVTTDGRTFKEEHTVPRGVLMENNVARLGVEDLLDIIMDRMTTGIGGEVEWSAEQDADFEHAGTYRRRLQLIAEKYKLDERHIR